MLSKLRHVCVWLRAGWSGDRILVGARFSAPVQTGPGTHPASYTMGTGSFPGVKRPGRGVEHPLPFIAEVKERVELYLYYSSGPSWHVLGWTLPLYVCVNLHIYMTSAVGTNVTSWSKWAYLGYVKLKLNSVALVRERTIPTERPPTFLRIEGCHVVSATGPHGR